MAYYLFQATYTDEAIANMVKSPQNRAEAVRVAVEKMGGSGEGFWFAFGEYDTVEIIQRRCSPWKRVGQRCGKRLRQATAPK